MLKRYLICSGFVITIAFALLLPGCSENSAPGNKKAPKPVDKKSKVYDFPEEEYGDPDTWSTPRIQFCWEHPDDKDFSVWSMRLDGTDIRRVVGPKELTNAPGSSYYTNFIPRRSPNNRYLAVAMHDSNDKGDMYYIFFDLKTKTKKVHLWNGSSPEFNWTQDSKHVYFYTNYRLVKYNIENATATKQERKMRHSALYLIDNDSKFLAVRGSGFNIYDLKQNLFKSVKLDLLRPASVGAGHHISPNGKYLKIMGTDAYAAVCEVNPPNKVLLHHVGDDPYIDQTVFIPGERKLAGPLSLVGSYGHFDIETKEIIWSKDFSLSSSKFFTLINHSIPKTDKAKR